MSVSLLYSSVNLRVSLVHEVDGWRKSLGGVWIFAAGTHQFLGDPDSSFSLFHSILYSEYVGKPSHCAHNSLRPPFTFPHVLFVGKSLLHWHRCFQHCNPKDDFWPFQKTQSHLLERLHHSDVLYSHCWGCRDGAAHSHGLWPYVAICKPLHYLTIMSLRVCTSLLAVAWTIGLIHSVAQLAFVVNLPFCGPNEMDSFYCDFPRFIKLACTDTYRLEFLVTANSGFISMGTFLILIVSYIFILVTVRKHSSGGSSKALSTLSAHITVVVFFFGPCIIVYVWPFPTLPIDKFLAIFDALITPFMNPIIYTLINKEMKMAMRRLFGKVLSFKKSFFMDNPRNSDWSWLFL